MMMNVCMCVCECVNEVQYFIAKKTGDDIFNVLSSYFSEWSIRKFEELKKW